MSKAVRRRVSVIVVLGVVGALALIFWPRGRVSREQRANDALSRVVQIELDLAKVRGLAFDHEVPAAYQTGSNFRGFVHRTVDKERTKAKNLETALVALGLLPANTDLAQSVETSLSTQAAAYYDPEAKKFFLVMVPENDVMLDLISAHELTHGLQDQHFGLERYLSGVDADALAARRFVVEGDAMFAAIMYTVYKQTHVRDMNRQQLALVRTRLERFASLDTPAMVAMLKQQAAVASAGDPELQKAIDAMDAIPLAILAPLVESYMKGAIVALDAYEQGGWRAVDDLYAHPPESTEQVLHPKERLLGKRDRPHRVTLPTLDGYEVVDSDVLGELQWSVYFRLWKHEGDGHEEENWDGDRYAVLRKDGKLIVLVATMWDSEYDATVFYHSYLSTLATRFPGGSLKESYNDTATFAQIWVRCDGNRVFVVDGGDHKLLDMLVAKTTFDE